MVDLPDPFPPTSAWTVPGSTVTLTSCSATVPGKCFVTPCTLSAGSGAASSAAVT